jgi:methylated-DNA-[protein]-cysteine S-methyltransferase
MKNTIPALLSSTRSPLGKIWLAATAHGLSGLWFEGQKHLPDLADPTYFTAGQNSFSQDAERWLQAYFKGQAKGKEPERPTLDLSGGTDFQQSVWQALLHIPFGQSLSYRQIAQSIHNPSAVRAVGAAVGRNPVSLIVPCHRVIGANGSLTGYAGGLERKTQLLQLEGLLI